MRIGRAMAFSGSPDKEPSKSQTKAARFAPSRPMAFYRGISLADWLVDEYLMLGLVPFQNWMLLAIAIVILSIVASAWLVRH